MFDGPFYRSFTIESSERERERESEMEKDSRHSQNSSADLLLRSRDEECLEWKRERERERKDGREGQRHFGKVRQSTTPSSVVSAGNVCLVLTDKCCSFSSAL